MSFLFNMPLEKVLLSLIGYCGEKLHLQSYLEMLWSETGYFGLSGNNLILFNILLYFIENNGL